MKVGLEKWVYASSFFPRLNPPITEEVLDSHCGEQDDPIAVSGSVC